MTQADIDRGWRSEVREAREIGLGVLPPDVNESFHDFAVIVGEDGKERIRFGLSAIKNVGDIAAEEIVTERKKNGKYTLSSKILWSGSKPRISISAPSKPSLR